MAIDQDGAGVRLRTDQEGRTRLALPRNHPNKAHRLRCGQATDGGDNETWDARWRVDAIALSMPWRPDGLAATDAEKVTFTRMGVLRAFEKARRAEGLRRGRREAVLNIRRGDPLLDGQKLPETLDRAWAEGNLPPPKLTELTDIVAARLGVFLEGDADDGSRLRAAAGGRQHEGRPASVELRVFVRALAEWWWENTRRRPERRVNDARKAEQRGTFVDFAVAAAIDCSRSGKAEPEGLRSVIRHEIAAMEKSGVAPWMAR